jgi:predicted secreted protein
MKNGIFRNIIVMATSLLFLGIICYPSAYGNDMVQNTSNIDITSSSKILYDALSTPPLEQWNSTFGGAQNDQGKCVKQTSDHGYIIVGQTGSYGAGGYDIWLIKTDALGAGQWNRTFGGSQNDFGSAVLQSTDGGYVIIGSTYSYGAGNEDIWLIKTDSTGHMTWNATFGGTGVDYGSSLQQTSDGGYILAGRTSSYGVGHTNVWLIKTDKDGKETWNKTFGVTNKDAAGNFVQQTSDGGYIITGSITTDLYPTLNVWLIKVDANGNKQWEKNYGDEFDEWGNCVQQT